MWQYLSRYPSWDFKSARMIYHCFNKFSMMIKRIYYHCWKLENSGMLKENTKCFENQTQIFCNLIKQCTLFQIICTHLRFTSFTSLQNHICMWISTYYFKEIYLTITIFVEMCCFQLLLLWNNVVINNFIHKPLAVDLLFSFSFLDSVSLCRSDCP
jgi:adenine-specific DNA methylase